MGRPIASILADLPPDQVALLRDYEAALRAAGYRDVCFPSGAARKRAAEAAGGSVLGNRLRAARRLLKTWGLQGWLRLPQDEQVAILCRSHEVGAGWRSFLCWLAITGRQSFPPGLMEAVEGRRPHVIRWVEQGRLAAPALMERLAATARRLGYAEDAAWHVCHAVAKAAAYAGKAPDELVVDDLVSLSDAMRARRASRRAENGQRLRGHEHQPLRPWTTANVLYHAGLLPEPPDTHLIGRRPGLGLEEHYLNFLRERWAALHDVAARYLARRRVTLRPATVKADAVALRAFFRWLTGHHPEVAELGQLDRRRHIEVYLRWVCEEAGPGLKGGPGSRWTVGTRRGILNRLRTFFRLLTLWDWPEAPTRPLILPGDLPRLPDPLPKAFDDVEAARMVQEARSSADPLERLIIELLAACGLRAGEARDLKLSDIVAFGGQAGYPAAQLWLRVPLGKLGNDRYLPIGPELQAALEAFLASERSSREWEGLNQPPEWTGYLLARQGRRVSRAYCNMVVQRVADRAGVNGAHAHRWRHTFATQAVNRGMDLATIATLLGHTTLEMTMVYARIANPKLREEFERVSQQVQAFYNALAEDPPEREAPVVLPAGSLGPAMMVARRELEWRRLGNGWCTRRAYLDCRHELVCERCVHFNTDMLFSPVLEAQYEDAKRKGQQARVETFAKLIAKLKGAELQGDVLPLVSRPGVADSSSHETDSKAGALA